MKKSSLIFLPLIAMLLTGCNFGGDESSVDSKEPSEDGPITSEITSNSDDDSSSEPTSENSEPSESSEPSETPSETTSEITADDLPDKLQPAKLSEFRTTYPVDPVIKYVDTDYIVKEYPNKFTYPIDARYQPTPAYLEFWHPETKLDIRIVADIEVFKLIEECGYRDQKYADYYFPVTLDVRMNGKRFVYYEVGMRMKGNLSRTDFLDPNTNQFIKEFSFKLSFNELWDDPMYDRWNLRKQWTKDMPEWDVRDNRTFMGDVNGEFGLKKIDLKWNKSRDSSLIMQPYVFSFFQRHGLISQNSTLTTLKMNDTKFGIVTINEPIDKHLLRRYFDKKGAGGDLYKVGWGQPADGEGYVKGSLRYEDIRFNGDGTLIDRGIIGEEDKYTFYTPAYDAKEYDGKSATPFQKLVDLMKMLKDLEGKTVEEIKPLLEEKVDIESFFTYAALSYLTGNPDDMRNNGNNYYIFFNPNENNKAYFIPYDYDWSLNLRWDGVGAMDTLSPYHSKQQGNDRSWQENRLYWATIINKDDHPDRYPAYNIPLNLEYRNRYTELVKAFSNDFMYTDTYYNSLYNTYRNTYGSISGSDFDNGGDQISPFLGTDLMVNFINGIKNSIATFAV